MTIHLVQYHLANAAFTFWLKNCHGKQCVRGSWFQLPTPSQLRVDINSSWQKHQIQLWRNGLWCKYLVSIDWHQVLDTIRVGQRQTFRPEGYSLHELVCRKLEPIARAAIQASCPFCAKAEPC